MKHVLIVLALLCSLCLHAKEGKIKYGKTVVYEGQIENKQPKGQGVLRLFKGYNPQKEYFTIEGFFNGNNITNADIISEIVGGSRTDRFRVGTLKKRIKVESVNVIYDDNKNKNYHDIQVILNNIELNLYHGDMHPSECFNFPFPICIDNLVLHCTNKPLRYSENYVSDSIIVTISSDKITKIHPELSSIFHYDNSSVDKVECIMNLDNDRSLPDMFSLKKQVFWVMKDGARFNEDTQSITYPNGDKIKYVDQYNDKGWTGTRNFSDGKKVTSKKVNNNYIVNIAKPKEKETYTGTLKDIFAPLYPKSTYAIYTGTQTVNGVTTKWIKGETFEARHERLKNILSPKWLALVEAGQVSETQARVAIQNEKDEKRRAEESKKREEEEAKKREEYLKKHPEKKKKYHEVGKMENCWMCFGSGLAPKIVDKPQRPCYNCAGKGWYIEHYW